MSWASGPSTDEPSLITDLMDLIEAAFQQGRAVERVDQPAAMKAHRASLAALARVLRRVDPDGRTDPSELLIDTREPGA